MKQHPAHPGHCYDEHLVLKVPLPLWMAMLFLVRHAILVLSVFLNLTVLAYLGRSALARDVFADFPIPSNCRT